MYLESDEDDAMETGEDKDESKSPSKSVDTAALSPEPSKFDEPRSPVLSDKKGNHYYSYHLYQIYSNNFAIISKILLLYLQKMPLRARLKQMIYQATIKWIQTNQKRNQKGEIISHA